MVEFPERKNGNSGGMYRGVSRGKNNKSLRNKSIAQKTIIQKMNKDHDTGLILSTK